MIGYIFYDIFSAAIILAIGLAFSVFAILCRKGSLHIPAGVLLAIGGILLYQGLLFNWESWVYLWPLVFGGLGMGFILYDQSEAHQNIAWLGRMWFALAAFFSVACYALWQQNNIWFHWPMVIIGSGLMFLLPGIKHTFRAFRIPGTILLGTGAILMTQWITKDWYIWTYVWALIPASLGLGLFASSAGKGKAGLASKIIIGISILLYLVFATVFANHWQLYRYWPIFLIIIGLKFLFINDGKENSQMPTLFETKKEALE